MRRQDRREVLLGAVALPGADLDPGGVPRGDRRRAVGALGIDDDDLVGPPTESSAASTFAASFRVMTVTVSFTRGSVAFRPPPLALGAPRKANAPALPKKSWGVRVIPRL